jgi:Ca2+-binding EF-hand superfamily protein
MKASIAILSALILSVVMTQAEEGGNGQKHKKPNPGERFAKVDTDGSGSISLTEFQAAPRAKDNAERAAEVFKKIDTDGSGDITKDEMMRFAAEHKNHAHKGKKKRESGGDEAAAE